jgi:hypothetical protein
MRDDPRDKEEGPRSFARLIENLGDGDVHAGLSDDLFDLIGKLRDASINLDGNAKVKGDMSIKLKVSIDARGNVGVDVDSSIKVPKRKRPTAQAWITAGGNLTTEHPRQTKLPLQEVPRSRVVHEVDDRLPAREEV